MTDPVTRALTGSANAPTLTFERSYRASAADLWTALTSADRLARWFGRIPDMPHAVGDPFVALLSDEEDDVAHCVVETCDRPRELAFGWRWGDEAPSRVAATLIPLSADETILRVDHARLEARHAVDYGGGWEELLHALDTLLGGSSSGEAAQPATNATWGRLQNSALQLERSFSATVEAVWAAFTTTERLRSWWWTHLPGVEITVDAREGGGYRLAAPQQGFAVEGTYLTVQPTSHLAFTWRWIDDEGASRDEACDLRFLPEGGGTRLILRHTGPWPDGTAAESYRQGWDVTLDALERMLGT